MVDTLHMHRKAEFVRVADVRRTSGRSTNCTIPQELVEVWAAYIEADEKKKE